MFVGTALGGAGVAAGAALRHAQKAQPPGDPAAEPGDAASAYDISAFERIDPRLLLYKEAGAFDTGFARARQLCAAPDGLIAVAGDKSIRFFEADGRARREIPLDRPARSLHISGSAELLLGLDDVFEVYDLAGRRKLRSPGLGTDVCLTAITTHERTVYLADAGRREIVMCDRGTGEITGRFGRKDQPPGAPGFVVPSPYFDLAIGPDHRLHCANPGRLRMETYTLDGRFESAWGGPGMAIDRFCGCCNPVHFALTATGDVVTSEKGLARVKVYSAAGEFRGVVAGPEALVADKELAKRACADCRVGAGFDVAVDGAGRVLVLDPFARSVRMFAPLTPS